MLGFVVVVVASGAPYVPGSWNASVKILVNGSDPGCAYTPACGNDPWTVSQDDEGSRLAMNHFEKNKFAPFAYAGTPAEWFNITEIISNATYLIITGLCYVRNGTYENMFGWLDSATRVGAETVEGVDCEVWELVSDDSLQRLAIADVPVQYNATTSTEILSYTFSSFAEGADPSQFETLDISKCYDPPTCGVDLDTSENLYVFHPANEFDVAGQDVGDERGDAFFVCEDVLTGFNPAADHDYEWVSMWRVDMYGDIGQYANCNGYPSSCDGKNTKLIGREAPLGLGYPDAGQCANNSLVGNWFSLPVDGECTTETTNCAWTATRIKTINSSCLFDKLGFEADCRADARAPFDTATATFSRAFHDLDGCPPIDTPTPPGVRLDSTTQQHLEKWKKKKPV